MIWYLLFSWMWIGGALVLHAYMKTQQRPDDWKNPYIAIFKAIGIGFWPITLLIVLPFALWDDIKEVRKK